MLPPICLVCMKDFRSNVSSGGRVHFTRTTDELERAQRMREQMMVGATPGAGWFCEDHLEQAKLLTHLSMAEAIKQIREATSQ